MSLTADLLVVLLLIVLNGIFAMSELAIVSARRIRLKQFADSGHKGAALALKLAMEPSSFLSIVQIGMTLNSVLAGAFSGATLSVKVAELLHKSTFLSPHSDLVAFALTVIVVTYFSLVVGELVPKRIGLSYAEAIAMRVALAMSILAHIALPVVWILKKSSDCLLTFLHLSLPRDHSVTEEEIRDLIAEGTIKGVFKPVEKDMLDGVMRLADRTVRTIMTPRLDMIWLGIDDTPEQHKKIIRSSGYSRFPVARGDLIEIIGIVYAKDILNAGFDGLPFTLKSIMRPALIVPDSTPVLRLFEQFKKAGQHIALVVDEYGSVEGLVSISDILEAVTGELPERGQSVTQKPIIREDGSWLIDGMTPLDEVETLIGIKGMRGEGDFHTLAGFMLERLGRLPSKGDSCAFEKTRFEVVSMDHRRIEQILIYPPPDEDFPSVKIF